MSGGVASSSIRARVSISVLPSLSGDGHAHSDVLHLVDFSDVFAPKAIALQVPWVGGVG